MIDVAAENKGFVLLVDDSPDTGFAVKHMLEFIGFEVALAWNGRIAVEKSLATPYTVILMDIEMQCLSSKSAASASTEANVKAP